MTAVGTESESAKSDADPKTIMPTTKRLTFTLESPVTPQLSQLSQVRQWRDQMESAAQAG